MSNGNGAGKKVRQNKQFMDCIRALSGLFENSDQKAVQAAVDANDFNGLCKALRVSEKQLASIIDNGAEPAKQLMKDADIAHAVRRRESPTAR